MVNKMSPRELTSPTPPNRPADVEIPRYHMPESCCGREIQNVLLPDTILYLPQQRVIPLPFLCQILSIPNDQLIIIAKEPTHLIRPDMIDLRAGEPGPLAQPRVPDRLMRKVIR